MAKSKEAVELLDLLRKNYFGAVCSGVMQKYDENELTFIQRNVLIYISNNPNCMLSDISSNFCLKNPSMTRIIYSLEGKGLVERTPGTDDRRKSFVKLSKKGLNIAAIIDKAALKQIDRMLENLSAEEQKNIWIGCETLIKGYKSIMH